MGRRTLDHQGGRLAALSLCVSAGGYEKSPQKTSDVKHDFLDKFGSEKLRESSGISEKKKSQVVEL